MFKNTIKLVYSFQVVLCVPPILLSQQRGSTAETPIIIKRSLMFTLTTITYFACNERYTLARTWHATFHNGTSLKEVSLLANPTVHSSRLVVRANSLAYGLYTFTFQVTIHQLLSGAKQIRTIATYVKIIPSGLVIYAFRLGVRRILIGANQKLVLNPLAFSFDLDHVVAMNNLRFLFYCTPIGSTSSQPTLKYDLSMFKNDASLEMSWNQTCFASKSKVN